MEMRMMLDDVCHFIPFHKDYHSIHTINFVLETDPQKENTMKTSVVNRLCYVCRGSGFLHTRGRIVPLKEGDVFIIFAAKPYRMECSDDFVYMYISFTGIRGNMIMEKLELSDKNFLIPDCSEVYDFWEKALKMKNEYVEFISESVLLYTFAYIAEKTQAVMGKKYKDTNVVALMKKYIDDNFTNNEFSLDMMSSALMYNKKYLSVAFKKGMQMSVVDYLNTIRIQYACTMMQQGYTSVKDISNSCGYKDSQYFSKLFKSKMGMTPKEYIKSIKEDAKKGIY